MKIYLLLSAFFLSLLTIPITHSQNDYKFNRINAENGLSNSEIKCIYKDSDGFMWFGSPSGLNRYDGYEVTRITQNLSLIKGTANNDIERIQESADGKLWLRTAFGFTIYDLKQEKFEYDIVPFVRQYAGVDEFWTMYIDKAKNYWFITWNDIRFYDLKKEAYITLTQGGRDELSRGLIVDMAQGENRYWFLFDNGLLECMDAQTHKVISRDSVLQQQLGNTTITTMRLFVDSAGDVWVYAINDKFGMASYDFTRNEWQTYSSSHPQTSLNYIPNNIVFGLTEDRNGTIWIGTDHGGITLINKRTGLKDIIRHDDYIPLSLPENAVKCLYCDDLGIVWLGTYKQGVGYYHDNIFKFKMPVNNTQIPYADVNCFEEDPNGNLWIGTNGGGLLYYDRKTSKYTQYKHVKGNPNTPSGNVIVSLEYDQDGQLWIGHYLNGLDRFNGRTFTNYQRHPDDPGSMTDVNFWVLHCDKAGNLWTGTLNGGVMVIDPKTGKLIKHLQVDGSVYAIIEKKSGEILVGTQSGLFIYSTTTDKLILYEKDVLGAAQLGRYDINSLLEDSRGLIWIGTRNGLFVFNPYSHQLQLFTSTNGLAADLIQNIQEDAEHNIWVSSNLGLSLLTVYTKTDEPGYFYHINNYDQADGLQGRQFNFNAGYLTSQSELVFGGLSGFNIFLPSAVNNTTDNPKVVLTDFQLYNNSIHPGQKYKGRTILAETISQTRGIRLKHSDNYFTLSFAAQDYNNTGRARYYYKLEGFNDQWLEADRGSRKVTYTNLNPGEYTFYLKAINNDLITTEYPISLKIHILPPFWQTIWAWMVYIALIIGTLLYYWRYTARRTEKKLMYARERLQTVQQHQLHEMKLRFFTNISHEFRTPLTLIITPLEGLLKKTQNQDDKVTLSIMHRNALQLLQLVNQLLDFRKLDSQGHKLNRSLNDMGEFIREQAALFSEALNSKNIKLTIKTSPKHLYMSFDEEKMGKVFINLLFNAQKFTPPGGKIEVEMTQEENEKVRIMVTDNGIGIPPESLEKIFERFYQVKQNDSVNNQDGGSGIGLHLAKEFVTLHGGDMWAENIPEGGSRFVIVMPNIAKEDDLPEETTGGSEIAAGAPKAGAPFLTSPAEEETTGLPKLLIVDDNDDFRLYLSGRLKEQYTILEAENGMTGRELAFQEIPDMILTDVMMPQMDGITMSKQIKADIRTSHIPLILLTAKSGEESKLEGLTAGADDYITKPFNMDILQVKIHNLVERGRQQRQEFQEQIKIEPSKITVNSLDEKLIRKALECTETNISNPDFSVEDFSRELGMSRVHLYKKLVSLTGKTPIEFIRVVRLKRAAQLLKESQLTVSEIAYEVGFNNPKYFRKYFKEEFGMLPSQYGGKEE